jgi:hypothetical protein
MTTETETDDATLRTPRQYPEIPVMVFEPSVTTPWGDEPIWGLGPDDAAAFNEDPDAYAARHFGMTKVEYVDWIDGGGSPLCGCRTRSGALCRNPVGAGGQLQPDDFRAHHRMFACSVHRGMPVEGAT